MLNNVSYRYKIPASLSLVIVVTALAVALPLISNTNDATKQDLVDHALSLGKTVAQSLQPALLHDDMWPSTWRVTPVGFRRPKSWPASDLCRPSWRASLRGKAMFRRF